MTRRPVIDRLMGRIEVDANDCWIYPCLNEKGYGVIGSGGRGGRTLRTHRVTYEHFVAPIQPGLDIDHLCRNRACCNPEHLEPVDRSTNLMRGVRKTNQTTCKWGHKFDAIDNRGRRICTTCRRERQRKVVAA